MAKSGLNHLREKETDKEKFLDYIRCESFKKDSIIKFFESTSLFNPQLSYYSPLYRYNSKVERTLNIKTTFFKLTEDPLKRKKHECHKFFSINPNNDDINFACILKDYQDKIREHITEKYNGTYNERKNLIHNQSTWHGDENYKEVNLSSLLDSIEIHFKKETSRDKTEIINYNTSKKYPKSEKIANIDNKEIERVLKRNKEVRIIFTPISWADHEEKVFGSKLVAQVIEIKYPNSNIQSSVDNNELQINPKLTAISI